MKKVMPTAVLRLLAQIQEAVELAYDSLMATGKNPRKNPKPFQASGNPHA